MTCPYCNKAEMVPIAGGTILECPQCGVRIEPPKGEDEG
jgi:hypothetical protein